jgi:hypothetical protein
MQDQHYSALATMFPQGFCVEAFADDLLIYTSKTHVQELYVDGLFDELCRWFEANGHEWPDVETLLIKTKKHGPVITTIGTSGLKRVVMKDFKIQQGYQGRRRAFHRNGPPPHILGRSPKS